METLKRCDLMEDAAAVGKNRTAPEQEKATITVAEAGRRLGIGRNSAYEAARRGDIPAIRLGKRLVVPLRAFERMLTVELRTQLVASELVKRLQSDGADKRRA